MLLAALLFKILQGDLLCVRLASSSEDDTGDVAYCVTSEERAE